MKVVHLISGGDTGGAKTSVHALLSHISARAEVTMVCFMEGDFAEEARALGIRTVVMPGRNILKVLKTLEKFIRDEGFDIIHCHGSRGNLMGALLRRRLGLPVVTTVHSDPKLDYLGRPFSRLTYGTINSWALRRMDYHIGVSDVMVDKLIARGFDADRVFTIYNGLDFTPREAETGRAEFFRSVGLQAGEGDVVVGIAARLNPVKDVATLIRGFAKARERSPQLRLVIAGDGEEMDMLRALAKDLGVEHEVCFAGWLSDTRAFYQAVDVNALTSLSEGFPYSIAEGARAGLATVSSRVGGVPYLIDHGVTGLLFEPGDVDTLARHLSELAEDKALRERLGARLYEKGRELCSIERIIDDQMAIYDAILRRAQRPQGKRDGALVCGAYGRGNAGDDAILEAIVKELREIDPDLPIWVMSRKPKETRRRYRVNALYTFNVPRFFRRCRRTTLYINGGGSLMQDVTSRRSLWFYLFTISAAHRRGCRVLMYGCGIGPIQYPRNRRRCAKVLERSVDAITLRDTHSAEKLRDMGVTRPKVVMAADPTVTLPAAGREVSDGILESQGLDPKGRYIGFTLRTWPGYGEKAEVFAQGVRYAWEKYGLTPLFLPIEARLDTPAAQQVAKYLDGVPYHIMPQQTASDHIISLFARMEVVVSMRLHALVFAAGQGVPLVGVVYDEKISSFLDYIGQDLHTPLADVTAEKLRGDIDKAVARSGDREFLLSGVERLRQVEGRNSETAAKLLKGERL